MKIVEQSANLSKKDMYYMAVNNDRIALKDAVGTVITVCNWLIYSNTHSNGEEVELMAIRDDEKTVYCTNSKTFIEDFRTMVNFLGEDFKHIRVDQRTSSKGRNFLLATCVD